MRKVREVPTQFPREEDQMSDYVFASNVRNSEIHAVFSLSIFP